jgi:hypothetical protein
MKITPEDIDEIKGLAKSGLSLMVSGLDNVRTAEVAFDFGKSEYNVFPIIKPIGMALLLSHMEKKYNSEANIFIIDYESNDGKAELSNALNHFSIMEDGSKMSLLIWSGGHWRTAYCERKNNKTHIAVIDSLGIGILDNPVEAAVNSDSLLREKVILYRSVNRIQVDHNNCGIIALRVAHKLAKEKDFFGKLKTGNLILTKQEASNHFKNSNQNETGFKAQTNYYFVLPPEYFSLAQRIAHLAHYKKEFGDRKGIKEFSKISKRTNQTLFIDDLFNKKHRKESLSDVELGSEPDTKNYNVLYFCNKYIASAILSTAKAFASENLSMDTITKQLKSLAEKHILNNNAARSRLYNITPESAMDNLISNGDFLVNVNISGLNSSEVQSLKIEHEQHCVILIEEENLDRQIKNKNKIKKSGQEAKQESEHVNQSIFGAGSGYESESRLRLKQIKQLSSEINGQINDYLMRIKEEKESILWISEDSIKLWEDKIAVLTAANLLLTDLTGQTDPLILKIAEKNHSGWNNGTVTKELVEKVKMVMGIPQNWEDYRPGTTRDMNI